MKIKSTFFNFMFTVFLSAIALTVTAQTATPFQGPSDASTAAPTTASTVGKVVCSGGQITLKGPTGGDKYQWYKINSSGVKTLVKTGPDNTYTEVSTDAGYYNYQLVQLNSLNCSSTVSDLYKVYVLPPLTPAISATNASVCENGQTTSVLSVTGLNSNYTYTYQWLRNDTPITSNGTSATYNVSETTAASVTYKVNVTYTLSAACTASASQIITVVAPPAKPTIDFGN